MELQNLMHVRYNYNTAIVRPDCCLSDRIDIVLCLSMIVHMTL